MFYINSTDHLYHLNLEGKEGKKEMFYLSIYGVGHMVKNHSDSERGNPLPPHGLYFSISSKGPKFRARCSSVVRGFAHGAMGRRIDPSWGGPIELLLVPASVP